MILACDGTGSEPTYREGFSRMLKLYVTAANAVHSMLHRDDRGATAVEYGLIVALIAAVIIGVVATLGKQVADAFSTVSSGM